MNIDLSGVPTRELVEELHRRLGISEAQIWRRKGITSTFLDEWRLGYYDHVFTLPYYDYGGEPLAFELVTGPGNSIQIPPYPWISYPEKLVEKHLVYVTTSSYHAMLISSNAPPGRQPCVAITSSAAWSMVKPFFQGVKELFFMATSENDQTVRAMCRAIGGGRIIFSPLPVEDVFTPAMNPYEWELLHSQSVKA